MAFNGRATYDNPDAIVPDVSNLISIYSRMETPFLDYIGDSDTRATAVKHSWTEDALLAHLDTMNDSGGISGADTSMTVSNGGRFNVNDIIMIDDEIMQVTAIATNVLTITRGYGDSVAATHADAAVIRRIVSTNTEGDDVKAPKTRNRVQVSNYCGIIEPPPSKISLADEVSQKYGGINEVSHQMDRMVIEALRELEIACILSTWQESAGNRVGADDVVRTIQGLRWWPTTNVVDAAGTTLTEDYFSARLSDFYTNGAKSIDFVLCGAAQARKIDRFTLSARRYEGMAETMKVLVTEYTHRFSTKPLRVILSPYLPPDELLFGDSELIKVAPFVPFRKKQLAESGFYSVMALHGEYTLEVRHAPESTARIQNLATV